MTLKSRLGYGSIQCVALLIEAGSCHFAILPGMIFEFEMPGISWQITPGASVRQVQVSAAPHPTAGLSMNILHRELNENKIK